MREELDRINRIFQDAEKSPAMRLMSALIRRLFEFPGLLSFAAGAAGVLAFAPFSLSPIAVLALAFQFYLWNDTGPGEAFRRGWFFGLGFLGFGVFWLHISIDQFGNVGWLLAVAITLAFILAMALYFGLAGWCARLLPVDRPAVRLVLVYPALWVLGEWLRGWVLTGFPWLTLGYSQIGFPLQGLAPLLGVYGVSWGVALSSALLVLVLGRGRRARYGAAAGLVLLWGVAGALTFPDWTGPAGEPLEVTLVQGNIPQELKWKPEQRQATLGLYRALTRSHWSSDLIIWPETAVPAFGSRIEKEFLDPLAQEARSHNSTVLLGIPVHTPEDRRYYNAMLSLGSGRDVYFKRHLVPFGEFLPLKAWLQPLLDWLTIPMSDFSAGAQTKPLVRLNGYQAGISICYEDAFGEEVIQALPEAAFLVNASNDAWFGDSLAPHQHLEIARMRAVEAGRFMLRSTNTGISAIIDPKGRITGRSAAFVEDVLTREISPLRGMTPYAHIGNYGVVVLVSLSLITAVLWRRRSGS